MENSQTNYDSEIASSSTRFQEIALVNYRLEELPAGYLEEHEEFYSPLRVSYLNLSQNNFVHIHGIGRFANLVSLDISNNSLVELPEEICEMSHLCTLIARNNLIEDLPKRISSLTSLESLNLSGNRISSLPEALFTLTALRQLHFGANMLELLPFSIGLLTRLEILYLGGNRLKEIPATIGRLSKLTSLVLCDNVLETIPSTLGQLVNLESLSLHNNLLRTLPTEIIKLQNLQQLSLRNNPLVQRFVHTVEIQPQTLKEMAGRIVRMRMPRANLVDKIPRELVAYLSSANQCVNPKCKGVYFEACVEHVKFVDFCGKYRVPLLQFLCSTRCSANVPESPYVSSSSSESDDEFAPQANQNAKMRKVLLG